MRPHRFVLELTALTLLAGAPTLGAAQASPGNDLKATIVLHGMPCDTVVDVKRQGDSDYIASCKDGNRYHVFVNSQGRVVVEKVGG
jgi:hypothetical protein